MVCSGPLSRPQTRTDFFTVNSREEPRAPVAVSAPPGDFIDPGFAEIDPRVIATGVVFCG
jgi:hypothetical protein